MMTVRFATGFSVQYNSANYAHRNSNGYTDLYTEKDGVWIAQVPTSAAIVECVLPCRTYNPLAQASEQHARALECCERELRSIKRELAAARKAKSK